MAEGKPKNLFSGLCDCKFIRDTISVFSRIVGHCSCLGIENRFKKQSLTESKPVNKTIPEYFLQFEN